MTVGRELHHLLAAFGNIQAPHTVVSLEAAFGPETSVVRTDLGLAKLLVTLNPWERKAS